MKNQNLDLEVAKILEDAPGFRKALRENYDNLLNVADYCCSNYTQTGEGSLKALEETKQFTTQSLASVAYQISTLASSVLQLLDAQTDQLRGLESSINLIGQTVEMHKEKVARREIGILTTVRRVARGQKIITPTAAQLRPPYARQPISYQELDELGHGVKISGKQPDKMGTIQKHGPSIRASKTPEPVQCPTAPPAGGSSFGKPVAPPTIPPAWQAPPECVIIEDLLNESLPPPPSADPEPAQDDGVTSILTPPPPPDALVGGIAPPPPPPPPDALIGGIAPPPPPLPLDALVLGMAPPPPPPPPQSFLEVPINSTPPPPGPTSAPPTSLETVLEENSFPSPSPPPPHCDDDILPPPPSDGLELLAPPPPPAATQEVEDLEIPAPPLMLGTEVEFEDLMPPLPPPVEYDAPPQYLEKVVALYSYEASKPDDLALAEGDIIYMTHRHDDGWCQGVLNGKHGFFPENYVQLCS